MGWIFRSGEENTAERCQSIARGFRQSQSGKDTQAGPVKLLKTKLKLQSFALGFLHAESVAHGLAVLAPRRRTRLLSAQAPGAQTIQYSPEML